MSKEKAIIEMVIRWLDSNIDDVGFGNDPAKYALAVDSADLKQKIKLALDGENEEN
jgi:hypothetical protein